jgi:hypothetical protein
MASCCSVVDTNVTDSRLIENRVQVYTVKERDARITAIALGLLAVFLFAASFVLFGMGTLSPTTLMGLGMLPYLGGALLSCIGIGIVCGMFLFGIISAVRNCHKEQWKAVWSRQELTPEEPSVPISR